MPLTEVQITNVPGRPEAAQDIRLTGEYLIVDPCYVDVLNNKWNDLHEMWEWDKYSNGCGHDWVVFKLNGKWAAMWGTKYGDGSYPVYRHKRKIGRSGVDSGKLAFVPKEFCEGATLGTDVKVDGYFKVDDGNATVGEVKVVTNDEEVRT